MDKLTARIGAWLAALPPAYSALVMSSGIVSIGCHLMGFGLLARLLFWLNLGCYLLLWLLTLLRLSFFPRRILDDLRSQARGMGFFTMVAATGILGSQLVILWQAGNGAGVCLVLGLGLWLFFMYAILAALARGCLYVAPGAWLVTFLGMLGSLPRPLTDAFSSH